MRTNDPNLIDNFLNNIEINDDAVDKLLYTIGNDGKEYIKKIAPKNKGFYNKGFKLTKDKKNKYVIHNDGKEASLGHLLENGHLIKYGKKTKDGYTVVSTGEYTKSCLFFKRTHDKMSKDFDKLMKENNDIFKFK